MADEDGFKSSDGEVCRNVDELQKWMDASSSEGDASWDSECDSEEAQDVLGELKTFPKPCHVDQAVSKLLFIDMSASMKKADVRHIGGGLLRRIDAARHVLKQLVSQQQSSGAIGDLYSIVTFSKGSYAIPLQHRSASEAVVALSKDESFIPCGPICYETLLAPLKKLVMPGLKTQVVFLSDGCPSSLQPRMLPDLQLVAASYPGLAIHTVGLGQCDFSILQQIAQIARGSFSQACCDMNNLVNTITSLSKTMTCTRQDSSAERPVREVAFDSARRYVAGAIRSWSRACRISFRLWNGQLLQGQSKPARVAMHKNPFMQGGMRFVHRFADESISRSMVAKFSKYPQDDNSLSYVEAFVKNTKQTRILGKKFHEALRKTWQTWRAPADGKRQQKQQGRPKRWAAFNVHDDVPRLVSCAQCFVYEGAVHGAPSDVFVAEAFLRGSEQQGFVKWINNRGEILVPASSANYSMAPEAFAHFCLDSTNGRMMASDLQGVLRAGYGPCRRVHLTDPQMLSLEQEFGPADLGQSAMQKFRSLHTCNQLCKKLHLSSLTSIARPPRVRNSIGRKDASASVPVVPPLGAMRAETRGRSPGRREKYPEPEADLAQRQKETVKPLDLLLTSTQDASKKALFVGEYTHLFTAAAAKLVTQKLSEAERLNWTSTELRWPAGALQAELKRSVEWLRRCGVTAMDGVDATQLPNHSPGQLAAAIWVMPFPRGKAARSRSSELKDAIQDLIQGFVKSVANFLDLQAEGGVGGKVSIILLAHQHLAWKLPTELSTAKGPFLREVFWMDLAPLLRLGYHPRFGDERDASRTARYHENDEVVVVQWRRKRGDGDRPGGMTDQRVRSESARSRSRSCSSNR
ncbi:unnamed protein product [Effrenium voratum]|uniref:Alpha-type protein kinase domain-containing protein n=1 Tax=Effrenium voratum TaxID=2562239 RepID=A0AA36MRD4_9DINO|nr:unnamed protein product [Effrenium voratum]